MANPRVRPHLQFYPEDTGGKLEEYWQASHWHEELEADKTTPLAAINQQHFFINEPCLLTNGLVCMPIRWFYREKKLFAKAWTMRAVSRELDSGWIVEEFNVIEVPQDHFLVSFSSWPFSNLTVGLPSPKNIFGEAWELRSHVFFIHFISGSQKSPDSHVTAWTLTDPMSGNRWRALAKGSRVYAFPIWLYCDDMSGNMSKKWNKHNSFLFTAAGLPRSQVHLEYNVHFLCTSNLAPPLEMLDGIVDQLE